MSLTNWWRTTLNPDWFHGHDKAAPFFEGWYYKLIDREQRHKLAVIPGMIRSGEPHAFIQILDGNRKTAHYLQFPVDEFVAGRDAFAITIGANTFSAQGLNLAIKRPEISIQGELNFTNLKPWPVHLSSPGIMGWYAWVPTMECYHGVVSMDHGLEGQLELDGSRLDFSGGRGYMEKDWGRSFPSAWIWMQSNHFQQPEVSLTASIAMIPWRATRFRGFIVGLLVDGQLYRFATYTGAKTESLKVVGKQVDWVLVGNTQGQRHRLSIQATRADAIELAGPTEHDMGKRVPESLNAQIEVRLTRLEGQREIELFHDTGTSAGLEIFNVEEELLAQP